MTDENQEFSVDSSFSSDSSDDNAGSTIPDGYIPKADMGGIISKERKKALEAGERRGYERALQEINSQPYQGYENVPGEWMAPQQPYAPWDQPQQEAAHKPIDENQIVDKALDRLNKQMSEREKSADLTRKLDKFASKINDATSENPDLGGLVNSLKDDVTKRFAPEVVQLFSLIGELDNAAEVTKEIVSNPAKLAALESAISKKRTSFVSNQLKSLSNSLSQNKKAAAGVHPVNAPPSRIESSSKNGPGDVLKMSVSEIRRSMLKR